MAGNGPADPGKGWSAMKARLPSIATALLIVLAGIVDASLAAAPEEGTARSADGVAVHYRVSGAGDPALVFIHGWSCDGSYWDGQTAAFAENHRVVMIDLAGHGDSGLDRVAYSLAAFGEDVVAVADALDLQDMILVGHSMGGPVAVEAAERLSGRVRGIVGVDTFKNPSYSFSSRRVRRLVAPYRKDFVTATMGYVKQLFPETADPDLVERIATDMASGSATAGAEALKATLDWYVLYSRDKLTSLKVPLFCINSDMHPTKVEEMQEVVPYFDVRYIFDVGHFPMVEAPDTFNGLLIDVVAQMRTAPKGR